MNAGGLTLTFPDREREYQDYQDRLAEAENTHDGWRHCPLCGDKLRFGQHTVDGPNGYLLHKACFTKELTQYAEYAEEITIDNWLSDAIFDEIQMRGNKDRYNY